MVVTMKNIKIIWIVILVLYVSACVEPSYDYLHFDLNPSVDTVELNTPYLDPGATASYGLKTLTVSVISNTVDTSQVGVYEIVYQTTYETLTQTLKRIVTVVDETPPVILLQPGIDTITVGSQWIDAGILVTDQSGLPVDIDVIGEVGDLPGVYVITYQATDAYGNQSSMDRVIYVIE